MKKNDIIEFYIDEIKFPNKSIGMYEGTKVIVKGALPQQKISARIIKKRHGNVEARIVDVLEKSPLEQNSPCPHFGTCGGCTYQNLPYNEQLKLKEKQVRKLLDEAEIKDYEFLGIEASPKETEYRNKMEFSFGDEQKEGNLALGMRKKNSYYEVVNVNQCCIIDEDYRTILNAALEYFIDKKASFYHKGKHTGMLRHLVIRKSPKTKQILVNLITSSQIDININSFPNMLLNLNLDGTIVSILHTINDSVADIVKCDALNILYGDDYYIEQLFNLKFKVSAFSFFQTNSLGAEKLYSIVKEFIGNVKDKTIFDLYCGTGTIAQVISSNCKKVVGIEIVEEAVKAAKENMKLNNITNCEFIAGDVLSVINNINQKPDIIILDPPRDGIHPKAIDKIINFKADKIIYISCKPTSLVRDLEIFESKEYKIEKIKCIDMFPSTYHVETCVLLSHKNPQIFLPSL